MTRSFKFSHSIAAKLILAGAVVVSTVIALTVYGNNRVVGRLIPAHAREMLAGVNLMLNGSLAALVFTDDLAVTADFLKQLEQRDSPLFTAVTVYGADGEIFARMGPVLATRPEGQHAFSPGYDRDKIINEIPLTLADEEVGRVAYEFSVADLHRLSSSLRRQTIGIGFVGLILALGLLGGLGFLWYRRIEKLTAGVQTLADADTPLHIRIPGRDEISLLADNFNAMADAIATRKAALSESELKFRTLFMENRDGIGVADARSGLILECNQALADMVGTPRKSLIGAHQASILAEPDAKTENADDFYGQLLSNQASEVRQARIVTRAGKVRDVEFKANRIELEGQTLLQGIFRDVTERKRAEQELLRTKRLLDETQAIGSVGGWEFDPSSRQSFWTDNQYRLFGYEPGEIENTHQYFMERIIHPNDRPEFSTRFEDLYTGHDRFSIEFRGICKDGSERIFNTVVVPEIGRGGRVKRIFGSDLDVTEIKHAQVELRESEERFRLMIEISHDLISIADKTGRTKWANPAWRNTLGHTPESQSDPMDAIHPEDRNRVLHIWLAFQRDETDFTNVEYRYRTANGTNVYLETTARKCVVAGESLVYVLAHDITTRRRMEVRLQQTQKIESIGNLAGGIAHDFNNILFPIVGMSEMLLEDLDPDSLEYDNAREILNAGKRGSELVKQILAFSRRAEHKMLPIRIQHVINEVVKLCRATIPVNIEITREIQSDCGLVMADATQVHQIAMNLITNAFHAVEETNGQIVVRVKEVDLSEDEPAEQPLEPGRYVMLSVSDTGSGIDPAVMEMIFDPYFTTKEQGKGTGLGLAVVYGIVKEHLGDIKVDTEPGIGTTFTVYLPLMQRAPTPPPAESPAQIKTGTESILIVDDEEPVARLEQQILSRLGYRVVRLTVAAEALALFRSNPNRFDLVVTDMTMPGMTGDRLAQQLIAIRPDIPVIICTGFSEKISRQKAAAMGIKGFLMKPVVKSKLAAMVREVLDAVPPTTAA